MGKHTRFIALLLAASLFLNMVPLPAQAEEAMVLSVRETFAKYASVQGRIGKEVVRQVQEMFPDREVVGVQTREVAFGGGNIHCITQQQPRP